MSIDHRQRLVALGAFVLTLAASLPARAHCDTTKGPVVAAARAALESGNVGPVLAWVRAEDEAAVTDAFRQTLKVRALGPEARSLADQYFFETVVRIHRAGEGAPYTGLTDAEPEPIVAATDRALAHGSADELEQQLVAAVHTGLAQRFAAAQGAKGRAFVEAYVPLVHWVEGVYSLASEGGEHHPPAAAHATASETGTDESGPTVAHLPWILTGLLALAALVEAALLLRRRRPAIA
jgi:Family of unknown function (DUF6448)